MNKTIKLSFSFWAIVFIGAFVAFAVTPAEDFGLSRGWNKVGVFMKWQFLATAIAIFTFFAGWSAPKGSGLKWLSRIPILFVLLLVCAFAATVVISNAPPVQTDTPPANPPKVTKPATVP